MNDSSSGMGRTAQILKFLLKYRSAGVFTGLDLDAATIEPNATQTEGKPTEFAHDLEALGPTFIKIGQALSTRPDMVPAPYLAALGTHAGRGGPGSLRLQSATWSNRSSACA
jgi:predicted unusual protein kinase regulating ubiquinone biosynthesis (AarF/ABC1/UbiB family)